MRTHKAFFGAAVVLLGTLGALVGGCVGDDEASNTNGTTDLRQYRPDLSGKQTFPKGGEFKVESPEFGLTCNFDPVCETQSSAWTAYNAMGRTLLTYDLVGPKRGQLTPDLAEDMPTVSEDGKEFTFRLKKGIRFGPPVNREVTSQDVAYSFERMATEAAVPQMGFYYEGVIDGFEQHPGPPRPIAGIRTPDDRTIVFRLARPVGDFLFRLALPMAMPTPREVARCFPNGGDYGRYVVAAGGPYMLEGSEDLDISSCDTMKPIAGWDPSSKLTLVRNPEYDPATDDTNIRANYVDRFTWTTNSNVDDIYARIIAGTIDSAYAGTLPPPAVLQKALTDPELSDQLTNSSVLLWVNLVLDFSQKPTDDPALRRAVGHVLDRKAIQRTFGGEAAVTIAKSPVPAELFDGGVMDDYDPWNTEQKPNGDVEAAKQAMKESPYDTDKDGICDAPECKNVLFFQRAESPYRDSAQIIERSLAKIGIEVTTRLQKDYYGAAANPPSMPPIGGGSRAVVEFKDPAAVMLWYRRAAITPGFNANFSNVGITPEIAEKVGFGRPVPPDVPDIEAEYTACEELPIQTEERTSCWQDLTRKVTEELVPQVAMVQFSQTFITSERTRNIVPNVLYYNPEIVQVAIDEG